MLQHATVAALMAGRKKNPINDIIDAAGAWLGGSRGAATNPQVKAAMDATRAVGKVVDTATGGFGQAVVSDAQRMAQSGSSTPSALYKTAAVNLAAAAAGVGAAKVAGKVAEKVMTEINPFYGTVRAARSNPPGWVRGEATAEDLMKLRSTDRFGYGERVVVPPKMKDDAQHLANIRKQNTSTYHYEDMHRYSEEDMSRFSTFQEDIANRGIQNPVSIGRIKGKPTLLEGNHRVIAQFDIDPKAKVPIQISENSWDTINKTTKNIDRRAAARNAANKIKNKVPKRK